MTSSFDRVNLLLVFSKAGDSGYFQVRHRCQFPVGFAKGWRLLLAHFAALKTQKIGIVVRIQLNNDGRILSSYLCYTQKIEIKATW